MKMKIKIKAGKKILHQKKLKRRQIRDRKGF